MIIKNINEISYFTDYGIITFGKKSILRGIPPTKLPSVQLRPNQNSNINLSNNTKGVIFSTGLLIIAWLLRKK